MENRSGIIKDGGLRVDARGIASSTIHHRSPSINHLPSIRSALPSTFYLLPVLAFLLFLSGCTAGDPLQSNEKVGCCDPSQIGNPLNPECHISSETSSEMTVLNTRSCSLDNRTCDVQLRINFEDGTHEDRDETMPICTQVKTASCIQRNCEAQVCGAFDYRPQQVISYQDIVDVQKDLQDNTRSNVPADSQTKVQNLYGMACILLPMDENLSAVFQNTRGSFINSFRFGIGGTFEDFERYRQLFPFSDQYCNLNPNVANAKERFANYFKEEDESTLLTLQRLEDRGVYAGGDYCPAIESPFRTDLYGNSTELPNYRFEHVKRTIYGDLTRDQLTALHATGDPSGLPDSRTGIEYDQFDRSFYDNTLRWFYRDELNGTSASFEEPLPATFECTGPDSCQSNQCDLSYYRRGMCQKNDDSWVECGCFSNGRQCDGQTVVQADVHGVSTMQQAVSRYKNGGDLYIRIPRTVEFYRHEYNPDCGGEFSESVDDSIDYCQMRIENGQSSIQCWDYNEPATPEYRDGSPDVTSRLGNDKWDQFTKYHLKCDGSGPATGTVNTCQRTENTDSKFDLYTEPLALVGSGIYEPRLSPQQPPGPSPFDPSDSIFHFSCHGTAPSNFSCDSYHQLPENGGGDTERHEFEQDYWNTFSPQIYFFGQQKEVPAVEDNVNWQNAMGPGRKYIGYTLLSPSEFQKTNFYQACNLDSSDYDTLEISPEARFIHAEILGGGYHYAGSGNVWVSGRGGSIHGGLSALDIQIPVITPGQGFEMQQHYSCSTFGSDTDGIYWYTRYVTLIRNTGDCKMGADNYLPVNRVLGWCEGCSFLTLAQQGVKTAGGDYTGVFEQRFRKPGGVAYPPWGPRGFHPQTCNRPTDHQDWGVGCFIDDSSGAGEYRAFDQPLNSQPESIYMQEKQIRYLKEGVQPVIDLSDASNWVVLDDASGFRLLLGDDGARAMAAGNLIGAIGIQNPSDINKYPNGPAILIVDDVTAAEPDYFALMPRIKERALVAKQACSRCLIGLGIDTGPAGGGVYGSGRRLAYSLILGALSVSGGSDNTGSREDVDPFEGIDLFAIPFYPSEYVREDPTLCEGDKSPLYDKVLEELVEYGKTARLNYEKMLLVNKMGIDTRIHPECWSGGSSINDDAIYRLTSTIALRQRTLTEQGILGVIYSDTSQFRNDSRQEYTAQFCSLNRGARNFVASPALTVFRKVPLQRAESVICQQCTATEISLGKCSTACGNGAHCTLPADVSPEDAGYYKCPADTFPLPARPCAELPDDNYVRCRYSYNDGTIEDVSYRANQLNDGYPDVIASIPAPYRCTLTERLSTTNDNRTSGAAPGGVSGGSGVGGTGSGVGGVGGVGSGAGAVIGSGGISIPAGSLRAVEESPVTDYTYTKQEMNGRSIAPIIFTYDDAPDQDCGFPDPNAPLPTQCSGSELPIRNYQVSCTYSAPLSASTSASSVLSAGTACTAVNDCTYPAVCDLALHACTTTAPPWPYLPGNCLAQSDCPSSYACIAQLVTNGVPGYGVCKLNPTWHPPSGLLAGFYTCPSGATLSEHGRLVQSGAAVYADYCNYPLCREANGVYDYC